MPGYSSICRILEDNILVSAIGFKTSVVVTITTYSGCILHKPIKIHQSFINEPQTKKCLVNNSYQISSLIFFGKKKKIYIYI